MDNQNPTPNPTPTPPTENIPAQNTAVPQTPPQAYTAPQPAAPPPSPKSFLSTKIILLIVILLIVLGAGGTYLALNSKPKPQPIVPKPTPTSAPTPAPVDETANWKTYTNNELGFYLKYPPDWKLIEDGSKSAAFYPPTSDPNLPSDLLDFYYQDVPFSPQPSPEFGMTPFTPITIAGIAGRQTQDDPKRLGRVGGCTHIYHAELPIKTGTIYFSSCISLVPKLQEILSTFKFTEISPTPTCRPRPACLDATPRCLIPETPDMCRPSTTPPPGGGGIVCIQDAKLCPDGKTYVGRQGPKCEFAACPGQ